MTAFEPYSDEDVEEYARKLLAGEEDSTEVDDDTDDLGEEEVVQDDDSSDDGEVADPEPATGLVTSPESPPLTPEQLLSYAQFDAILNARPDYRAQVEAMVRGEVPAPTPPVSQPDLPALPELDAEYLQDPAIKALYDSNRATLDALAAERARVDQLTQVTQVRASEEFQARATAAKAEFAKSRGLDPAKVEELAAYVDQRGLKQLINPADLMGSITQVLDMAYWAQPEYRTAAIEDAVKSRTEKNRKRQKLAGVGGGSGSTPRNAPTPISDEDRRAAMIREVAQGFGYADADADS